MKRLFFLSFFIIIWYSSCYAAQIDTRFIKDNAVTNAKISNMATSTVKGRFSGGTGDPEDLTTTQLTTLINSFTSGLSGAVPASGGGTTNFLRADGAWAAPSGGINQLTGDVTAGPGSGSQAATITANAVNSSKIRLTNDSALRARNAANSADVDILKLDAVDTLFLQNGGPVAMQVLPTAMYLGNNTYFEFDDAGSMDAYVNGGMGWIMTGSDFKLNSNNVAAPTLTFNDTDDSAGISIKSPSTLSASYTLTLPPDDGTSGQVMTTDGSGIMSWTTSASGANTALSNVASTAVSDTLNPQTTNTYALGSSSLHWANAWVREYIISNTTSALGKWVIGTSTPSGIAVDTAIIGGDNNSAITKKLGIYTVSTALGIDSGRMAVETGNNTGAGGGNTGAALVKTGDITNASNTGNSGDTTIETGNVAGTVSGNSGSLTFQTGTVSGGTRGTMLLSAREISLTSDKVVFTDRAFIGVNTQNQTSWGADLPGLVFDCAAGECATAGGGGLFLHGNQNNSLAIMTKDQSGATGSSTIYQATGAAISANSGSQDFFTGSSTNNDSGNMTWTTGTAGDDGGNFIFNGGAGATPSKNGFMSLNVRRVDATNGIRPNSGGGLTADPCGTAAIYPEGTLFYNDTSDYYCFCNGAGNDVQMHSPATACF